MEVLKMNTLYWFIESQTSAHFGIPKGAQMRLALNEPNCNRFCTSFTFKHCLQECTITSGKKILICKQNNPYHYIR